MSMTTDLGTTGATEPAIVGPLPRQRRHTLHFLAGIRSFSPVFLDTDVDMTAVTGHREAARRDGVRYSLVSYVLFAAARVLVAHPEANAAISGRLRPRLAHYPSACGKVAFDRTVDGHRVVLTTVLPDLDRTSLDDLQRQLDQCRGADPATAPQFAGARAMHRLPVPVGRLLMRGAVSSLQRRRTLMGTFAVSSLGHRPVDGFYSVGGTTVTLGLGRVADRPVAVDGRVEVRPVMRLSLTFDHRVIDGAEAADVLADLKQALENFGADPGSGSGADTVPEREPAVLADARGGREAGGRE